MLSEQRLSTIVIDPATSGSPALYTNIYTQAEAYAGPIDAAVLPLFKKLVRFSSSVGVTCAVQSRADAFVEQEAAVNQLISDAATKNIETVALEKERVTSAIIKALESFCSNEPTPGDAEDVSGVRRAIAIIKNGVA